MATTVAARKFALPAPWSDHQALAEDATDENARLINSVMPMIVGIVRKFLKHLRTREQAHYNLDDLLQEVWIELLCKIRYYKPDVGKFTTFSRTIVEHHLGELRNHCHVVDSPRDSARRLRSDEETPTTRAIKIAISEPTSFGNLSYGQPEAKPESDPIERHDEALNAKLQVDAALRRLRNPLEAFVLARSYGLGTQPQLTTHELARLLEMTSARVSMVITNAERSLAAILEETPCEELAGSVIASVTDGSALSRTGASASD